MPRRRVELTDTFSIRCWHVPQVGKHIWAEGMHFRCRTLRPRALSSLDHRSLTDPEGTPAQQIQYVTGNASEKLLPPSIVFIEAIRRSQRVNHSQKPDQQPKVRQNEYPYADLCRVVLCHPVGL